MSNKGRKSCQECKKVKGVNRFFKVDSPLFPDGRMNICSDCVRKIVDVNSLDSVIDFLRQIDKPFLKTHWNSAIASNRHPLGEYIRQMNSLSHVRGLTFKDSDGYAGSGEVDVKDEVQRIDAVETEKGEIIEYSDDLLKKWGRGYKKDEYLFLEKYYLDMLEQYDVKTPTHKDTLRQLSYLSVDRDRLRQEGNWGDYHKISQTMRDMIKYAGFTPSEIKGTDEESGLRTFSQIFEEVEKHGFRKPPPSNFNEDIVDGIIISLLNYYNRLFGQEVLSSVPDDIKEELEKFYDDDLTPEDVDDAEDIGADDNE